MKKKEIHLTSAEAAKLCGLLDKGSHLASVRKRAQVLQLSHSGMGDKEISRIVRIEICSVSNIRRSYLLHGFERAVYGASRSGRPRETDMGDEVELTALACSAPPDGYSRWTLALLQRHMKKRVGLTTIHLLLKKTAASRGGGRCGASGR